MMLGLGDLGTSLRITMVVVPVALYFLILGLLNSRPGPQLLRGRSDFVLLVVALAPLFALPVVQWVQSSWVALAAVLAAAAAALAALAPPASSWVIYNISAAEAAEAVGQALRSAGLEFQREGACFRLTGRQAAATLSSFPLLRNVSVRLSGCDRPTAGRFESALAGRQRFLSAETTPMTMALLLVATAMLVAPLLLVAPRAGEIVRILTGMLY